MTPQERERKRLYMVAYNERTKEARAAQREANREELRERSRRYREANKEKCVASVRRYYEQHADEIKAKQAARVRKRRAEDPVHFRKTRQKHAYGITPAQYDAMFAEQGQACAICKIELDPHAKSTHVDHCHTSGRVRGILCHGCNSGLGGFRDNSMSLLAAIEYLKKP